MSKKDVLNRVIKMFSVLTEVDEINKDSELINDLDMSSMDVLVLISSLDEEFNIRIPEKSIRKMVTVGDVVEIVEGLMK